jgi:hypothetical protein
MERHAFFAKFVPKRIHIKTKPTYKYTRIRKRVPFINGGAINCKN